ncbi:MAG: hypothetical protein LBH19_09880 [Dysgonamonadaceae bacterium]|jgi:hypothetical protein|nr:hypothetical protein [Dysgonamonadaceae bacterium]
MKYFISFCVLFFFTWNVQAQSIEEAQKLYAEGKYAEARLLFENIVKSTAKKTAAMKPEAWRSLGHIYYLSYEFEKSAEAYRQAGSADVVPLMERSERAARMLSRCEDIQLIDSVIIDKKSFLDAYWLSSESGRLENRNGTVVYENPLRDKRYFAAEKAGQGKRLYSEIRLQNEWTDRKEINVPVDSLDDNNYPFALPDGLTVYYASDNPSSIGGYDLFITRYNLNNDTWLAPNQMGMPFNSIANDYMLAIDEENHIGYFATDRFQPEGKVIVYTFIPNEEFTSVEIANERELIRRARITSIRDTWKPNANYRAQLEKIRQSIRNEQIRPAHDFVFIIDDHTIYYTIRDFRTDAAKQAFLKSQETKVSIEQMEKELDALRLEYSKSDTRKKQNMSADILSKETRLENLYAHYKLLEKNARNFEIRSIGHSQIKTK